jgi:FkbH-like protein
MDPSRSPIRCVLISDFNIENLAACLRNEAQELPFEVTVAPFGQVAQILADPLADAWQSRPDVAVIWTQPEGVIRTYADLLQIGTVPLDALLAEVDAFAARIAGLAGRARAVLVPTWTPSRARRSFGLIEMRPGIGAADALMRMNLRLAEKLGDVTGVFVLDAARWTALNRDSQSRKLWYLAKVPFSREVFSAAARDIKAAWSGVIGRSRKLILLDLDDTLWGGLVGEDGWEKLNLGGHDPLGESFLDFQRLLKALIPRGIILGILSKNEEKTALEAIDRHPEMVLRRSDFAGWRINWRDKVENLAELVAELNLGLNSVVFIDDSPVERGRVRSAFPEVLVPEWPADKMAYASALLALDCFEPPSLNETDARRSALYAIDRARKESQQQAVSLDEWLESLQLRVTVEPLNDANLARASQLLNKTNQMNLATRRMTDAELRDWSRSPDRLFLTFRVTDTFGDSGLTGLASLEREGAQGRVVDFVLSCRVIGRKVEETMIHALFERARSWELEEIRAQYLPTPKNKPCLEFWLKSGFTHDPQTHLFTRKVAAGFPLPGPVRLEGDLAGLRQ